MAEALVCFLAEAMCSLALSRRARTVDVTVTPFLYHLVQGTLQNTHVNRILLYVRTSYTLLFSVRFSCFFCDFA